MPLLQGGFWVITNVGCSIKSFLCATFDVTSEYIEDRIQTVFLDGKSVDDVDTAMINDGAVLALSAAMPGLVGATLRRGGHLAAFRNVITHHSGKGAGSVYKGMVAIRLFNLLVKELGYPLLKKGIYVRGNDLADPLNRLIKKSSKDKLGAAVDGVEIDLESLVVNQNLNTTELISLIIDTGT